MATARHPTPAAGSQPAPGSYRHVHDERTPPAGLPQSHLRGLGTDPAAPPRSALYKQAIDAAPDDVGRWGVNVEWTGVALDEHDEAVKRTGRLADAVGHLASAVDGLKPLASLYTALKSAVDEMQMAVAGELGVTGATVRANGVADAQAHERIAQLETDLRLANTQIATHETRLTARQAAAGGGVGVVLTTIIGLLMYVTGHWK